MKTMTVREASKRLNVSPAQVRTLFASGELKGTKENGTILIDADSVAQRGSGEVSKPFDPQTAWDAALSMSETVESVSAMHRHRYRKRLTKKNPDYLLRALARRKGVTRTFVADGDEVRGILAHESVLPTGISVYVTDSRAAEGYVTDIDDLLEDYSLVPAATGNLTLHTLPDGVHASLTVEGGVPPLIVAADAAEGMSSAARTIGRKNLERLSNSPAWAGKVCQKINNNETTPEGESNTLYHDPFLTALSGGQMMALWGKTDYWNKGSRKWGLLVTHLSDAGHVAAKLWDTWLSKNTRDSIVNGTGLGHAITRKLFILLAASHDVGKASPQFENQIWNDAQFGRLKDHVELSGLPFTGEYITSARHSSSPRHEYVSMFALARALPKLKKGGGIWHAKFLSAMVGAHHGHFPSKMDMATDVPLFGSGVDRTGKGSVWTDAQDALVAAAKELAGITENEWELIASADISPHAITLLSGAVVMADWISSNADYFPLGDPPPFPDPSRTEKAWSDLELTRNKWCPLSISNDAVSDGFAQRFPKHVGHPRPAQKALVKAANALTSPGLLVLEAPTGVGKTEAALLAAETLANKFGCDGVMFALPTRATSNAAYTRVNDWLESQNPYLGAYLTHGKSQFNTEFTTRLERFAKGAQASVHDNSDDETDDCCGELNTWFNNSRSQHLADFTVGTVDQVLLASALGKHISVRHLGLSGKVVILDEVHASDTYMAAFLVRTLRWLGVMGVPVVALTATLTPQLRRALHNAYSGTSDVYMPDASRKLCMEFPDAEDVQHYPVITSSSRGDTSVTVTEVSHTDSRTVKVIPTHTVSAEEAVTAMLPVIEKSGCSALIFNTVNRAQIAYNLIRNSVADNCEVILLHSRFTGVDRARLENRLLDLTGKPRKDSPPRPKHLIVVSTQVIEQSLDVDFDVMYSDIAPIDMLVQRMGRLHRHPYRTNRDSRFPDPQLYVGGYRVDEGGELLLERRFVKWVYSEMFLIRTAQMIETMTEIVEPQDLPKLMRNMDSGIDIPEKWQEKYDNALITHNMELDMVNSSMPQRTVVVDKNGDVPWKPDNQDKTRNFTPVRKGTPNVEVAIVYETSDGQLVLPRDGEKGQGWRVTGNLYPDLVKAIALRGVQLDGVASQNVRHTPYGSSKRGRNVPEAVLHHDIVPEWENRADLRNLGLLILTPDSSDLNSGYGVIKGTKVKKDKTTGKITYIDFEHEVRYTPETGLLRIS